jgi:hypothetical protein
MYVSTICSETRSSLPNGSGGVFRGCFVNDDLIGQMFGVFNYTRSLLQSQVTL